MPSVTGTFTGKITKQTAFPLTDQPNHEMSLTEVAGRHTSADPLWDNGAITYWGVTDIVEGKGTQRGYFCTVHGDRGRDWGTFEGKVSAAGGMMTVEGTWKFTGGDGEYRGVSGDGTFKTMLKSETEIDCAWEGNYQLARAQAR